VAQTRKVGIKQKDIDANRIAIRPSLCVTCAIRHGASQRAMQIINQIVVHFPAKRTLTGRALKASPVLTIPVRHHEGMNQFKMRAELSYTRRVSRFTPGHLQLS
jgi:hypothetical protein